MASRGQVAEAKVENALEELRSGRAKNPSEAARRNKCSRETVRDRWKAEAPKKLEKLLILPDTHCPFHDKRAWSLVMEIGKKFKPELLIHMGDLADCYALSSHSKDPTRMASWRKEREACRELRAEMDALGAGRKVFIEGNHSDRLRRYLAEKAPELAGSLDIDAELGLSEAGWEVVSYKDHIRIGKVYFTHDVGLGGKHSTSRAVEAFGHSICIGHHHQMQMVVQGDALGQHQVGLQLGWLGDATKIDYMHRVKVQRSWSLGFGYGYLDPGTGYVYFVPAPIVNYTAVVEGRLYRG